MKTSDHKLKKEVVNLIKKTKEFRKSVKKVTIQELNAWKKKGRA